MTKLKKALAAMAAGVMMVTAAGCTDTRYAMTYNNGQKVNAGVYIYNLYSQMNYEQTMAYYSTGSMEIDLDSDVDGQKMRDHMVEEARKASKEFAAVNYEADKLGITLTEDELKGINDNVSSAWESSGELLELEGISKDSVKQIMIASSLRTKLFDHFYAAGGEEEVTDADMQKFVEDNFVRYKTIRIAKSNNQDEAQKEEENKENEALRDEFFEKAKGLDYDEFDTVIKEYDDYQTEKIKQENATSQDEDTAAAEGPMPADDTDKAVDAPVEESADTEVSAEESAEPAEEADPHANDQMLNFGTMDDEAKESDQGKLAEFIKSQNENEVTTYEDDNSYYILIKGDVTGYSAEYAANNHDNLIQDMKGDEFQAKIDSWIDEIGITENPDAIKRYTAQAVYDKQVEYQKKNKLA